ncbi:MAG: HAD domain-containing protein [Paraclostridium sp.]
MGDYLKGFNSNGIKAMCGYAYEYYDQLRYNRYRKLSNLDKESLLIEYEKIMNKESKLKAKERDYIIYRVHDLKLSTNEVKHIQDSIPKIAGEIYIDRLTNKKYKCVVNSNTTISMCSDIFKERIRVLFLDIDGVLNKAERFRNCIFHKYYLDSCDEIAHVMLTYSCMRFFLRFMNNLIANKTDIKIVISSTYRLGTNVEDWEIFFKEFGIDAKGVVIGRTPNMQEDRGIEILASLKDLSKRYDVYDYISLDDDNNGDIIEYIGTEHCVTPRTHKGLDRKLYKKLMRRLKLKDLVTNPVLTHTDINFGPITKYRSIHKQGLDLYMSEHKKEKKYLLFDKDN